MDYTHRYHGDDYTTWFKNGQFLTRKEYSKMQKRALKEELEVNRYLKRLGYIGYSRNELIERFLKMQEALRPFVQFLAFLEAGKEMGDLDYNEHSKVAFVSVGGGSDAIHVSDLIMAREALKG